MAPLVIALLSSGDFSKIQPLYFVNWFLHTNNLWFIYLSGSKSMIERHMWEVVSESWWF